MALTPHPEGESQDLAAMTLPRRFGDYQLLEEIGRGGMGVVYRARQASLNRVVALKMILAGEFASPETLRRFHQEARAAASLQHPHIIAIHEIGQCEGQAFFTMDYVEGQTLAAAVREQPLPARDAARHLASIAEGVAYAHQRGILHRDLKPSNILIDIFGEPRIADFGLARPLLEGNELTLSGQALGSPGYISPEQAFGRRTEVGPASDVYSLGAVLYHLLTGRAPFQGESVHAVLHQIQGEEPVPPRRLNPSVPLDLETVCLKCLEKAPAARYPDGTALAEELHRFLRQEPIHARPLNVVARLWRWCRRRPAIAALGAGVLLLLLVVAVGSSLAAWRIAAARHAETLERQKSEAANRDLSNANQQLASTVRILELRRAEEHFRANDPAKGVARLAAILRHDPSNHIAATRLVSALIHGNWALPAAPAMRHLQPVESSCFSPDGTQVLTISREPLVRIWDAASGKTLNVMRHRDRVASARYSPDGTRIVTASLDGTARIWSSTNGEALTPPLSHKGKVHWAEFSPDGEFVVTASTDKTARLWEAETGKLTREFKGHISPVWVARFVPGTNQIVTGGEFGSIRIWNMASGQTVSRLANHEATTTALDVSSNGRRIVWAGNDGTARLWDPSTGQPVGPDLINTDFKPPILSAAFSPDGRVLLTTAQDGSARLWNAETGYPLTQKFIHDGDVTSGAFSPDGRTIVTSSGDITARLWSSRSGLPVSQPLRAHERVNHAAFSPLGNRVVTSSYDWIAQVWNVQPRRSQPLDVSRDRGIRSATFSPEGSQLLAASVEQSVQLFDGHTGKPGLVLPHDSPVMAAQFSPDGTRIVAGLSNGVVQILDARSGDLISGPMKHGGPIRSAEFSPNGEQIVTASVDGTARVWNSRSGDPVTPALEHDSEVVVARFSPDGRRVVTGSEDFSARVWDAQTGQPITQRLPHFDHIKWVEFSPDSERVLTASSDNTACIWSVATGRPVAPRMRHTRIVERAAFSPDGLRVLTCSLDLTARVWDASTGQALTEPLQHQGPVSRICFSHDGRRVLSGGWNGAARIWDSSTGLPLTEWLDAGGAITSLSFAPAGERFVTAARGIRMWTFPECPLPLPTSFLSFAETVAGVRLSDRGNVELVPRQELEDLKPGADSGRGDFYERVKTWFLSDPKNRTPGPF